MENQRTDILHAIHHYLGDAVKMYDDTFLMQTIRKMAQETARGNVFGLLKMLHTNPVEKSKAIQSLMIGYSAFYREPLTFTVLDELVLPMLLRQKGPATNQAIRVWSAACAAGQEAYTLAMLLGQRRGNKDVDVPYRIFATDVNPGQVKAAVAGFYHEKALENLPLKMVKNWFDRQDGGYQIKAALQENIHFSVFDLLHPALISPPVSIFGDFDLIVCANLLFYFKQEYREIIMKKLMFALAPGGLLITGQTEKAIAKSFGFQPLYPDVPIFTIKNKLSLSTMAQSSVKQRRDA